MSKGSQPTKDNGGNKYISKHQLSVLNRFKKRYQGLKTQGKRVPQSHDTSMASSRKAGTPLKNNFMTDDGSRGNGDFGQQREGENESAGYHSDMHNRQQMMDFSKKMDHMNSSRQSSRKQTMVT